MSRINRPPVKDGETIEASDLNSRFSDYTQTTLNAFNTRDAGVDLPQMTTSDFLVPFVQADNVGKNNLFANSPVTVNGIGALPSSGYVVGDGVSDTVANFGVGGLAITTDDVLRVYWHLNVNPIYTGTPWTTAGSLDFYELPHDTGAGSKAKIATNVTCWAIYLQWDITDATLTNWTEPTNQGAFTTGIAGETGNPLASCMATAIVPCWITSHDATTGRKMTHNEVAENVNWRATNGTYYYTPGAGTTTIYGLRLIIKGPLHSFNSGGANYLVHSLTPVSGTNIQLEYTSGTIQTIKQRLS